MVDGLNTGEYVRFYYDGSLKDFSQMFSGTIHGNSYSWHENGKLSLFSNRKYGRIIFLKKWDENGILVKEITAPSESDINEIKKYIYGEKHFNTANKAFRQHHLYVGLPNQ